MVILSLPSREPIPDHEQKKVALTHLQDAWTAAQFDGVDGDCMAQTCLFLALTELVSTYGEEAAARYTEGLAKRIHNGEFSLHLARQ